MRIGKEQAVYVGDTISRDVRGVRNAGWPLMIQIDNPRIYHKDEKYRGMGHEPDVKIGSLPEVVTAVEQYNRNSWLEGKTDETKRSELIQIQKVKEPDQGGCHQPVLT